MTLSRGILVVIEGINGAGKTTIINDLASLYKSLHIPVSIYKFPNRDGVHGKRIDDYLKGNIQIKSKYDIIDMFAADRKSVKANIENDLQEGKIVICDRYIFSAIAYQIPLNTIDPSLIKAYCRILGHFDKDMPIPDVVYLIEGNHLIKRGIAHKEVFHYRGDKSRWIRNTLIKVISFITPQFAVVANQEGKSDDAVNYICNDIRLRL